VTKWQAFPLRQAGQPWPGTNEKGGKLDDGRGNLNKNSSNCTINRADELSKRKGFVRGLNERFGTVVCGLFPYTDGCGREWLLVASDDGIAIRQPFVIPTFTVDDSYPSDSFDDVAGISTLDWRNTELYEAVAGSLLRSVGTSTAPFDAASYLRWFKAAASQSYQVQIEYAFTAALTTTQVVSIAIKGNNDLLTGAYLQADLQFAAGGAYVAKLYKINASRTRSLLGQIVVSGSVVNPSGFLTLTYTKTFGSTATFIPKISVVPTGGSLQEFSPSSLSSIEDADLGQISAIGCNTNASILVVSGGAV
jgi:hypothetical protein